MFAPVLSNRRLAYFLEAPLEREPRMQFINQRFLQGHRWTLLRLTFT